MRHAAILGAAGLVAIAACSDSNVPFFTAPTSVPNTPAGIDNGVTGLLSGTRLDIGTFVLDMAGFGRQAGNYTNTEPRFITYNLGVVPTVASTGATGGIWGFEYTNILQGKQIIATLPKVVPSYTTAQIAGITGLVQTIEAYNYMIVAEIHDTLGLEIQGGIGATAPPAQVCVKDGWAYIVALLDSANASLNAAGAIPIPVVLPPGFSAVSASAAPSTAPGSFAAFNRALAAKAGLELAYAIARHTPAITSSTGFIQWIAALLKTASNSESKLSCAPSATRASSPSRRAASICGALESTPTTPHPILASFIVSAPSPHPRSRIRSPACGASNSTTGAPRSETKRALRAYASGSQLWLVVVMVVNYS